MIHKAALVSKTIPKRLHEHMSVVIKVVNYVKSLALNIRLFSKLCEDMDADHTALLYHSQVRWLSKGNMLSRIFEPREKVKLFLVAKQKHDLLLAFGGDGFSTYLAYLADIFEALNQLNKKLQGPGTNIRSNIRRKYVKVEMQSMRTVYVSIRTKTYTLKITS